MERVSYFGEKMNTLTTDEKNSAKIALTKAGHMLVAAHSMFEKLKLKDNLSINVPVCIEIGLAFVGYAQESLEKVKFEVWDKNEIEKRIRKAFDDAQTAISVGQMEARMHFSEKCSIWDEYKNAEKTVEEYMTKHNIK